MCRVQSLECNVQTAMCSIQYVEFNVEYQECSAILRLQCIQSSMCRVCCAEGSIKAQCAEFNVMKAPSNTHFFYFRPLKSNFSMC